MTQLYGLLVIFTILLIWIIHVHYQSHILHSLLSGFWEASVSFCEESGLDLFCLYLDEDYDILGNRACYVLASQDNAIILNEPTVASLSMQYMRLANWNLSMSSPKYFNISFKDISDESVDIFPKYQELRFYPVCNKIVLFYDNTITAVLYKNPINTELKSITQEK
jgi:hypothetical protein